MTKTEWDTTLFFQEMDASDDTMTDEISDTGGSKWSDRMTVNTTDDEFGNSPILSEISNFDLMFRWIRSELSGPSSVNLPTKMTRSSQVLSLNLQFLIYHGQVPELMRIVDVPFVHALKVISQYNLLSGL